MSYLIAPDVSHYQPALTTSYPRDFVIFKATQGTTYLDSHFLVNAGVAHSLHASGKLAGAVVYHVYTGESVSAQFAKIKAAIGPTPPDWLAGVMIDLESWAGTSYALHGDQSTSVNALYAMLAAYMGSTRAALIYGNQGDLDSLAAHRDTRAPVILAAYTSELRYGSIRGAIGQQYSDGQLHNLVPSIGGQQLPRSTAGLGNCDHNVFPGYANGASLREWLRPTAHPTPTDPIEEIMAYYKDKAEFEKALQDAATQAVADFLHSGEDGKQYSVDTLIAHRLKPVVDRLTAIEQKG